jgi:hypothetical protein
VAKRFQYSGQAGTKKVLFNIFIGTENKPMLNIEYPPAMQSAERWIEIISIAPIFKCYHYSAQRHCGQVEQGISNIEVWYRSHSPGTRIFCRFVYLYK